MKPRPCDVGGLSGAVDPVKGVVVHQGGMGQAGTSGEFHDLLGCVSPIGGVRMEMKIDGQGLAGEDLEGDDRRSEDECVTRVTFHNGHAVVPNGCLVLFGPLLVAIRSLSFSFFASHGPSLPFNRGGHDVDGLERCRRRRIRRTRAGAERNCGDEIERFEP